MQVVRLGGQQEGLPRRKQMGRTRTSQHHQTHDLRPKRAFRREGVAKPVVKWGFFFPRSPCIYLMSVSVLVLCYLGSAPISPYPHIHPDAPFCSFCLSLLVFLWPCFCKSSAPFLGDAIHAPGRGFLVSNSWLPWLPWLPSPAR